MMLGLLEIKIETKAVAMLWVSNRAIHKKFQDIVIEGDAKLCFDALNAWLLKSQCKSYDLTIPPD